MLTSLICEFFYKLNIQHKYFTKDPAISNFPEIPEIPVISNTWWLIFIYIFFV